MKKCTTCGKQCRWQGQPRHRACRDWTPEGCLAIEEEHTAFDLLKSTRLLVKELKAKGEGCLVPLSEGCE